MIAPSKSFEGNVTSLVCRHLWLCTVQSKMSNLVPVRLVAEQGLSSPSPKRLIIRRLGVLRNIGL